MKKYVEIPLRTIARRNVVVVAPTGSGKTTAMINRVIELVSSREYSRGIFAVPTRALGLEIYSKLVEKVGKDAVGRDDSDARLDRGWRMDKEWSKPFIVTTYERLDSVILTNPSILDGAVLVIDEVHNLLFSERATTLVDILAIAKKHIVEDNYKTRIALLSATMPEAESLAKYLDAELLVHDIRPVELEIETVKIDAVLYWGSRYYYLTKTRKLLELINNGNLEPPILVYVPSRRWSEEIANMIGRLTGIGETVYLHAGLPYPTRRKIQLELSKENPSIKVVVATDTISQGVNLNFNTVVVLGLRRFLPHSVVEIDPAMIIQVLGRAGRPRYGKPGKGVIIYFPEEEELVRKALAKLYGKVAEPNDYPALVLRLTYSRRNIDTWIKYAYKIDRGKMEYVRDLMKNILIEETSNGYKLTKLGELLAREYLPTMVYPIIYLITRAEHNNVLGNAETGVKAFLYGYLISYYIGNLSTLRDRIDPSAITDTAGFLDLLREHHNSLETYAFETMLEDERFNSLQILVNLTYSTPPSWFPEYSLIYILFNTNTPLDNIYEVMRKAFQVLESMSNENLVSPTLRDTAKLLRHLHLEFRRLLKKLDETLNTSKGRKGLIQLYYNVVSNIDTLVETRFKPEHLEAVYIAQLVEKTDFKTIIRDKLYLKYLRTTTPVKQNKTIPSPPWMSNISV